MRVWIVLDAATKEITHVTTTDPAETLDDGEYMNSTIYQWEIDVGEVEE